jgi:hypothetical protein
VIVTGSPCVIWKFVVSLTVQVAVDETSTGVLSPVTVASAWKVCIPPFVLMLAVVGDTLRAVTFPRLTVIVEVPLVAWKPAVIVAVPGARPVTNPEVLTLAVVDELLLHCTPELSTFVDPSL